MVFITEMKSVYSAVRTGDLTTEEVNLNILRFKNKLHPVQKHNTTENISTRSVRIWSRIQISSPEDEFLLIFIAV